jgi:hypothetical protein
MCKCPPPIDTLPDITELRPAQLLEPKYIVSKDVWDLPITVPVYSSKLVMAYVDRMPKWIRYKGFPYYQCGADSRKRIVWYRGLPIG